MIGYPDIPIKKKNIPIGSMYAIYGNIYNQYTPNVSIYIYIYHAWILWDCIHIIVWTLLIWMASFWQAVQLWT